MFDNKTVFVMLRDGHEEFIINLKWMLIPSKR